jgi:hypothetical protein
LPAGDIRAAQRVLATIRARIDQDLDPSHDGSRR